jgi:hypothetical protein
MAEKASETRECPFCKEEIKATALRCKHCLADIPPATPDHGGVCPFCKEAINTEAIRCPHCQADLAPGGAALLLRGRLPFGVVPRQRVAAPSARATRRTPRRRPGLAEFAANRDPCDGCFVSATDADGSVWDLTDCDEDWCYYEPHPTSPYGVFE